MNMAELAAMKKNYQDLVEKEGKGIVASALKDFFADNPDVEAVRWEQYTPYFNDGDACVFGVGDPRVRLKGTEADQDDEDDAFVDLWSVKDETKATRLKQALEFLSVSDDLLLSAYGDHVRVTVTPTETTVDDYEHD